MSKENNLTDFLTDVADAIREKKGTTDKINPQDFSDEIKGIKTSSSIWTGHVDVEGLKAIGWDDDDIAYYQEHGVNWMEEDDEYHKVSDDNKALYGVLTADNIQLYKDRIVYLPKIDFSGVTSMFGKFRNCSAMVAIPMIDTSSVIDFYSAFHSCYSLKVLPPLNTSKVQRMETAFFNCYNIEFLPPLDTSNVTNLSQFVTNCYSLNVIPTLNTGKATNLFSFCGGAHTLKCILGINAAKATSLNFNPLESLVIFNLRNLGLNLDIKSSALISNESLLYIINNEAATKAITITLHAYAYSRLAEDPDIVAALENHPLVSLASA